MELTQEYLKSILHYDPDTGVFTRATSRYGKRKGQVVGCKRNTGYLQIIIRGKNYRAHRLAFLYMTGSFPGNFTDHINGVRYDNRWCNLRDVSHLENQRNKKRNRNNISGVTGVSWSRLTMNWRACISVSSANKHLGLFSDWFDAVCARKSAEITYGYHPQHGRPMNTHYPSR